MLESITIKRFVIPFYFIRFCNAANETERDNGHKIFANDKKETSKMEWSTKVCIQKFSYFNWFPQYCSNVLRSFFAISNEYYAKSDASRVYIEHWIILQSHANTHHQYTIRMWIEYENLSLLHYIHTNQII